MKKISKEVREVIVKEVVSKVVRVRKEELMSKLRKDKDFVKWEKLSNEFNEVVGLYSRLSLEVNNLLGVINRKFGVNIVNSGGEVIIYENNYYNRGGYNCECCGMGVNGGDEDLVNKVNRKLILMSVGDKVDIDDIIEKLVKELK